MDDDTRPDHPIDDEPEDDEDTQQHQATPRRLDRLMGAKDRADKEAERWGEIEDLGQPVPSQDQSGDITQPIRPEPPLQAGDTPTGQDTPSEALPPLESQQPGQARPAQPRGSAPPPFPHPTDRPLTPPSASAPPPSGSARPRPADSLPEPPRPTQVDPEDARRGVKRVGGPQHERYLPPEVNPDKVRLDSNGMPLPRLVPEEDQDATIVGQSAYRDDVVGQPAPPTSPRGYERPEYTEPAPPVPTGGRAGGYGEFAPPPPPAAKPRRARRRSRFQPRLSGGCLGRAAVLGLIFGLVALMLGGGASAIYYAQETAPSFENINTINDLQKKALQFNTTRIRDREGNILYQINDPQGGFRTYKTLDEMSPWVVVATVGTEERDYFTNPGFSIPAIIRAVIQNVSEGRAVSGASTITQQLTRALLLPEDERTARSYRRKIKEVFLAAELGRRFDKKQILELYLNQIYYGNLAYGIEAAAQTYFHKSAKDLTLAEASFLAGLPQAPAIYDPVNNKEGALQRQQQVLDLMLKAGCIDTGDSGLTLPCMTQDELNKAQPDIAAITQMEFNAPAIQAKYPHWVVYIQQLLEKDPTIGPALYTSGFDVITTLDPRLQDAAQDKVNLTLSGLTDRNVTNASVVVIDPHTGAILAMVGSRDFNDASIDGQVNVALTPQQPGSSIKPFTYMAAFRKGWTPATVIWDVPISYDIPGFGTYAPVNYDGKFRGPVSVRVALSNSINVPAIQALDYVGVPALLQVLNDVGITSLGDPTNPKHYGLSLTLGAGEVYLLEWANAYATLARGGKYLPSYAIDRIEINGKPIAGYPYQPPEAKQVLDADQTYLLTSILSDTQARIPEFGANSVLSAPYPAAAKTGTTNDFRDNWTMGYTTELAVGVWVGNSNNTPMLNVSGVTGAGPIWRGVMDASQAWYPAKPFEAPKDVDIQTVCADDGAIPSQYCTEHSNVYQEVFGPKNRPPAADQGLYRQLRVDDFTNLIANDNCKDYATDKFFVVLPNPSQLIDLTAAERNWLLNTDPGKQWMTKRGLPTDRFEQAPTESCKPDTPRPDIQITFPVAGQEYSGLIKVKGTADAPNFAYYTVDFGLAADPEGWGVLQEQTAQAVHNGQLGQIDLANFDPGPLTLRVTVYDTQGHHAERRVTVQMVKPTPTPGPTDTPIPAATSTPIPTPTVEATASPSAEPSSTPADTLTPAP